MGKREKMIKKKVLDDYFHCSGRFLVKRCQLKCQSFLLQLAFFCELPSGGLAVPMEIDLANERTPGDGSG